MEVMSPTTSISGWSFLKTWSAYVQSLPLLQDSQHLRGCDGG
jgi:hypothetical protein